MSKKEHRKPAAFVSRTSKSSRRRPRGEPGDAEAAPLPIAKARAMPDLGRGLRWGSILFGALGGLVGLVASLWLYGWTLSLIARDDWIGWVAVALLAVVIFALLMIILREVAGLARLGRLGKIRHEADAAARQNDKPLAIDVADRLKRLYERPQGPRLGARNGSRSMSTTSSTRYGGLMRLTERTLITHLDPFSRTIVA